MQDCESCKSSALRGAYMEVRRFGLYVCGNLAIVRILGASGFLRFLPL